MEKLENLIIRCWSKPTNNADIPAWQKAVNELLTLCYDNPYLFNLAVLGRNPFFDYQMEMSRLVLDNDVAVIASGNSLGKSYWSASMCLWYLYTRKDSLVITTSSSQSQLNTVLWKNIRDAWNHAKIPLGGKMLAPGAIPQKLTLDEEWFMMGLSAASCENMSGHHPKSGHSMVLCDESSGISEKAVAGLRSLNARKNVWVGNPLEACGEFFNVFQKGERGERGYGSLKISCLRSPHIDRWDSDRGLACQSFLNKVRIDEGEGSAYWLSHILAEFPTETSESLIPRDWLDLCEMAIHVPGGVKRLTIDLAQGVGRDQTVIIVRDDNGILWMESSNQWKYEETARRVDQLMRQFNVQPRHVCYDANGPGFDFANRLLAHGIQGVREFVGSRNSGGKHSRYATDRTAAAYGMKRRLDPGRLLGTPVDSEAPPKPHQFSIKPEYMKVLRPQLQALSVRNAEDNKVRLRNKEEIAERLGHSPDHSDCLSMSFFWKD